MSTFLIASLFSDVLTVSAAKVDDLEKKHPDLKIQIRRLNDGDPSSTKKYLEWGTKRLVEGEDVDDLIESIKAFEKALPRLEDKNFLRFRSAKEMMEAAKKARESRSMKVKRQAKDAVYLYNDDRWLVLRPLSHAASCHHGMGTFWCITIRDADYFDDYSESNKKFYFIIDKTKNVDTVGTDDANKTDPMAKIALVVDTMGRSLDQMTPSAFKSAWNTKDINIGYAALNGYMASEAPEVWDKIQKLVMKDASSGKTMHYRLSVEATEELPLEEDEKFEEQDLIRLYEEGHRERALVKKLAKIPNLPDSIITSLLSEGGRPMYYYLQETNWDAQNAPKAADTIFSEVVKGRIAADSDVALRAFNDVLPSVQNVTASIYENGLTAMAMRHKLRRSMSSHGWVNTINNFGRHSSPRDAAFKFIMKRMDLGVKEEAELAGLLEFLPDGAILSAAEVKEFMDKYEKVTGTSVLDTMMLAEIFAYTDSSSGNGISVHVKNTWNSGRLLRSIVKSRWVNEPFVVKSLLADADESIPTRSSSLKRAALENPELNADTLNALLMKGVLSEAAYPMTIDAALSSSKVTSETISYLLLKEVSAKKPNNNIIEACVTNPNATPESLAKARDYIKGVLSPRTQKVASMLVAENSVQDIMRVLFADPKDLRDSMNDDELEFLLYALLGSFYYSSRAYAMRVVYPAAKDIVERKAAAEGMPEEIFLEMKVKDALSVLLPPDAIETVTKANGLLTSIREMLKESKTPVSSAKALMAQAMSLYLTDILIMTDSRPAV